MTPSRPQQDERSAVRGSPGTESHSTEPTPCWRPDPGHGPLSHQPPGWPGGACQSPSGAPGECGSAAQPCPLAMPHLLPESPWGGPVPLAQLLVQGGHIRLPHGTPPPACTDPWPPLSASPAPPPHGAPPQLSMLLLLPPPGLGSPLGGLPCPPPCLCLHSARAGS